MQTNFKTMWVPLPAGRESEWRHAIELIIETMKKYFMDMQSDEANQYRLAWIDPNKTDIQYGAFLFNSLAEAKDTEFAMKKTFGDFIIWLEDREHNRMEIPS
jgi:hypothetical protein